MTIAQMHELRPVNAWTNSKVLPIDNPRPSLLYGVELEIESASNKWVVGGMEVKPDNSLRNGGLEFVTQPMTYSHLYMVLNNFFQRAKVTDDNYSERCSVHVHTDVSQLEYEQLANIAMLYQTFELVLFNWIGNERSKNIFCVPWYETQLSYRSVHRLLEKDHFVLHDWQKYTALNLLPVQTQGSIEWRHMAGTHDLKKIMAWCRIIGHIYNLACGLSPNELKRWLSELNTNSQYNAALITCFKEDADLLRCPGYESQLEQGVLNMKYSLLPGHMSKLPTSKQKKTIENWFEQAVAAQRAGGAAAIYDEWTRRQAQMVNTTVNTTANNTNNIEWRTIDDIFEVNR